jgi:hypothetical protein
MPTYRVYLINGNNRVASFRAIDADTDAEALKAARASSSTAAMWKSGISTARSGGLSVEKNDRELHAFGRTEDSHAGGRIEAPAEVAHCFGGGRVLQKIGNRLARFVVAHGRGWRAQFADTEAADNLVVVAVLVVGDQLANAGQQG